jgi:hypothetical protein
VTKIVEGITDKDDALDAFLRESELFLKFFWQERKYAIALLSCGYKEV